MSSFLSKHSFLSKQDQDTLDIIILAETFVPCDEEKQEGETHLGYLTPEQKAIYSLIENKLEEMGKLFGETSFERFCDRCKQISQLRQDVDFLASLFWRNIRGTYDNPCLGIRKGWEIVECKPDPEDGDELLFILSALLGEE